MAKSIKFIRYWRGRQPGTVDRALMHGVADMLVHRGIAVWHEPESERTKRRERIKVVESNVA